MRALLLPCLSIISLVLSGCRIVYSVHPLSTSDDAVEEPALEGAWTSGGNDDTVLCVQKSDGHTYSMFVTSPSSKLVEVYEINLVRLNDQLFADIFVKEQAVDHTEVEPPLGSISNHVIIKLDIAEDDLAFSGLDASAIQQQTTEGLPSLDFLDAGDVMLLTASTDDLRQYLSAYADRVFLSNDHYTRKIDEEAGGTSATNCGVSSPP